MCIECVYTPAHTLHELTNAVTIRVAVDEQNVFDRLRALDGPGLSGSVHHYTEFHFLYF
jgi:hypothetical protein